MAYGKYSPLAGPGPFKFFEWKEGTEGRVEVDKDGYDWYGYDENGLDRAGKTEWDYLCAGPDD